MSVNMGTVWDRTTEFLADNLRAYLPVALLALFLPRALSDVLQLDADNIGQPVAQIATLLLTLVALWGQLMVVALALDPDGGRVAAQRGATRSYGSALVVMLTLFVAILLLLAPLAIILAANGVDLALLISGQPQSAEADFSPGAGLLFGLYLLAFLAVALLIAARFTALYPALLAERRGLSAIGRSVALTRGLTWKLIGVWLLFLIVFVVAAAAVRSVSGVIVGLIFPADGALTPGSVVSALFGALVATLFTLVVAAFSAKLYRAVVPVAGEAVLPA